MVWNVHYVDPSKLCEHPWKCPQKTLWLVQAIFLGMQIQVSKGRAVKPIRPWPSIQPVAPMFRFPLPLSFVALLSMHRSCGASIQ